MEPYPVQPYQGYPVSGEPSNTGVIIAVVIVIVLLIIGGLVFYNWGWIYDNYIKETFGVPILDMLNDRTFENKSPPAHVNDVSIIPYTIIVDSWDPRTLSGTASVGFFDDVGYYTVLAEFSAPFSVASDGLSMTLSSFNYRVWTAQTTDLQPQGPWTFTINGTNPDRVSLTGHYDGVIESLVPAV